MMQSFDTPRTQAMRDFLAKEGPAGSGRIVGLSIEGADGVFLYTESAKWCDDNGAGTFRGDSETAAIRAFRERVRRAEAVAEDMAETESKAGNAPELAVTDAAFDPRESAIAPQATYATVWESDAPRARPVATVYRPMRGDTGNTAGLYTLTRVDGLAVAFWGRMPTLGAVRRALADMAKAEAVAELGAPELAEAEDDSEQAALAAGRRVDDLAERERDGMGGLYTFRARAATRQALAYARFRAARAEREAREDAAATAAAQLAAAEAQPGQPCPGCGHPMDSDDVAGGTGFCFGCELTEGKEMAALPPEPVAFHFCPRCEADTHAPGLCPDCEARAEFGREGVDIRREELAQRHRATGFRTLGQGGAFPLWAVAAERAASAIDDALELGLDLADPFGPGWYRGDDERGAPLWG